MEQRWTMHAAPKVAKKKKQVAPSSLWAIMAGPEGNQAAAACIRLLDTATTSEFLVWDGPLSQEVDNCEVEDARTLVQIIVNARTAFGDITQRATSPFVQPQTRKIRQTFDADKPKS